MKLPHTSLEGKHLPVMVDEVLKICNPKNGGNFMDCTFGAGGYSKELLKFQETKVVALDRDKHVIELANKLKSDFKSRFVFYNKRFSNLDLISTHKFDAVIFDLGLSSIQLDDLSRGFSFKSLSELDMSMGLTEISAKKVLNTYSSQDLRDIIKIFGEEEEALKISKNIVKERTKKIINTTDELVKIIKKSKKKNYKKIDESTKTFQAIRIFVNKEVTELIEGIIKATKILKPGGRLIVVSFHSIEDKIIKFYFKNFSKNRSRSNKYLPDNDHKLSLFDFLIIFTI
jgi:16S rRNA (cytosine1402-N4)-methyltransferase